MTPYPQITLARARRELDQLIGGLDLPRVILLQKMARSMTVPIAKQLAPGSDITTHNFEIAFSNQLLIHHATSDEPLKKKSFEYLLRNAFEADGKRAELNEQTKSWDVRADGVRYSLKTEAESKMSADTARIQKLMDAQWVAECGNGKQYADKVKEKIPLHLAEYDRILSLRVFRDKAAGTYRYQLLEVPKDVLGLLASIAPASITLTWSKKSWGADVMRGGQKAFRVLFDRLVKKVRIHGLLVSLCAVHGEWTIPLAKGTASDEEEDESDGGDRE